jgi:hypothetical protein
MSLDNPSPSTMNRPSTSGGPILAEPLAQDNAMHQETTQSTRLGMERGYSLSPMYSLILDWWLPLLSNNLGFSLGHQIYNRSIFVKGISMAISLIFHCDFSIVCLTISLGYFNCMPGYFIGIFQLYAWVFHCDF